MSEKLASVSVLERPTYGTVEAARILGLRTQRVKFWLDGGTKKGVVYSPVVRPEHTGEDIVTWGEFVELGYLREYRKAGVSLQQLRPVIEDLRYEFHTLYPLATAKPYVMNKELVLEIQQRHQIPEPIAIVLRSGQQLMLADDAQRFLKKIEFNPAQTEVVRMKPAGSTSPVTIDPLVKFGQPTVKGVATQRLWELSDAGESVADIAADYELSDEMVSIAIAYEEQARLLVA